MSKLVNLCQVQFSLKGAAHVFFNFGEEHELAELR